jgi:hypothetical protein
LHPAPTRHVRASARWLRILDPSCCRASNYLTG